MQSYYSNGKLLITGEYVVLDGAKAFALATKFGQNLTIHSTPSEKNAGRIIWESYTHTNDLWLQVELDLPRLRISNATFDSMKDGGHDFIAEKLQEIIQKAKALAVPFLDNNKNYLIKSKLTFPRNWGLGSSSTLVNNIAQWAAIDAFKLQFKTFGGSGYDIACAQQNKPIIYQVEEQKPFVEAIVFDPEFKEQLYFVHLNKKQNSREGIAAYRKNKGVVSSLINDISQITQLISTSKSLKEFEELMQEHEQIISTIIHKKPIQKELFSDYFGQTKSLGAWGGDFILATGNEKTITYFNNKGFHTVIPYKDIIL